MGSGHAIMYCDNLMMIICSKKLPHGLAYNICVRLTYGAGAGGDAMHAMI
jgi:hypothetical protein